MNKKGFTLVELLVVVVIVVLVTAFAVPSFKRAQENSKNQRAMSLLLDIASAAKNFKVYDSLNSGQLTQAAFLTTQGVCAAAPNDLCHLFQDGLLKPVAWDRGAEGAVLDTFNGYKFWVCSGAAGDPAGCCKANAVAAMENTVAGGRYGSGTCAWVDGQGQMQNNYNAGTAI